MTVLSALNPVATQKELPAGIYIYETKTLSTTRTRITIPSGAVTLHMSYTQITGATTATGRIVYAVLNSYTTADADAKLATENSGRIPIAIGKTWEFLGDRDAPITVIDVLTDQADSTSGGLFLLVAGVKI
jgi:hypothetical protein